MSNRKAFYRCSNGKVDSREDVFLYFSWVETGLLQRNAFGDEFPAFLKSVISTKLPATTIWGVGMFLQCDNEIQMCCCCCCCCDPLLAQFESLSYLFKHLKRRSSNLPLPKSFLAHGGGGQDTRQAPPPTSGSSPPVFVRHSQSSRMPFFIAHTSPFFFLFFFFFLLFTSFAPINVPLFLHIPLLCFFASSSVWPQLV